MRNSIITLLMIVPMLSWANLTDTSFEKAKECLGKRESNNNYKVVNRLGYMGKYQFGVQALEDLKYIRSGCYKKYRNRVPKSCWMGRDNIDSRSAFLNNKEVQDKVLKEFFSLNYSKLVRKGLLGDSASQTDIAQKLFVSHLLGVNAAYKYFKKNINNTDANGTTASEYSELARTCLED